jgi:hypothetical protein
VFEIGRSDPAQDWPQQQPGPLDTTHRHAPATVEVVFHGDAGAASTWHSLELATRASHGPCPDLRVDLNGLTGSRSLDPERPDRSHMPVPPGPMPDGRCATSHCLPGPSGPGATGCG